MRFLHFLLWAASAQAVYQGFNYGSTNSDGSDVQQSEFEDLFKRANSLQGTSGFTSARLYTMIQGGTTDTPTSAIPAAIDTQTNLLLGLWASAGQADFTNELTALTSAIDQYGTAFTSLIAGISVGSEDLYRISPTGIENDSGAGASPDDIVSYINQVRSAIAGTAASGASVGHTDTWTAWVNSSNDAVINAVDWLGMDAYPYYQTTMDNSIDVANSTFFDAYDATVAVANSKQVWITETGWPVSGPTANLAVPSVQNAETYWQDVACTVLGNINTWWFTLQDAYPDTPSPSFGIVGSDLSSAPLYDLTCNNSDTASSSAASSSPASPSTSVASATQPASSAGVNSESVNDASPGPQTSPTLQTTASTASPIASTSSLSQASSGTTTTSTTSAAVTSTTYQTTFVTITSCPGDCSTYATTVSPSTTATSPPAPTSSSSEASCPANLNGDYQYPHLIVSVDSSEPTTAYGTSYNGTITPTISSIFNFDLPTSYAGKTCSLVFLFPEQAALETSAYTFNGQGGITVNELSSPATEQTTYDTVPSSAVVGIDSIPSVAPGNSYVVASQACNAGARQSFEFTSTGGLDLSYFQDYNPSPIGAYIVAC